MLLNILKYKKKHPYSKFTHNFIRLDTHLMPHERYPKVLIMLPSIDTFRVLILFGYFEQISYKILQ